MAFDTKKWLTEDLGFSADEAEAMLPKFQDKADKVGSGYLRQADYSRFMNDAKAEATKTRATLDAENARLTAEMAQWAEMTAGEQAKAGNLRTELENSQERIFKLEQKLVRLAEDSGVDPKTILPGGDVTPPKKEPAQPVFDPSPIQQQIGGVAEYMLTMTAELPAIAQEHFELTGQHLDTRAFIAGIKADIKANKTEALDPVKRWEAANDIPAKRQAREAAKRQAELDAAREEGRVAARSEAMLPNTRPLGQGSSPVFRQVTAQPSKVSRPQPMDRLSAARAALDSGKWHDYKMPGSA